MSKSTFLKEIDLHLDAEFHYIMDETNIYMFRDEKTLPRFKVVEGYAKAMVGIINERLELSPKIVTDEISPLIFAAFRKVSKMDPAPENRYAHIHNAIGEYCFSYALLREIGLPSHSLKNNPVEIMDVDGFCNPIKIKMENEEDNNNSGFRY